MSFLKSKKDTKEAILFLKKDAQYDVRYIVTEIENRYPNLGKGNIIGYNRDVSAPLFYFSEDPDMAISADSWTISIAVHEKYFNEISTIIFDIVDIFEETDIELVRIGYIVNMFKDEEYIDAIKKKFLKEKEFAGVIDINIGWYRKLEAKFGSINCWERFITEKSEVDNLICQYDCNTPVDQIFKFEMKNIKEFLKVTDEYIESRVKTI